MEQIINYIKPELLVVSVVLFFIGMGLKKAETIKDKYIPVTLGGVGVLLCGIWVFATTSVTSSQEVAMALFTAIIQGILVAGMSVYANEVKKQQHKED